MKVALLMVDGFEDVEALAPFDILQRADLDVDLISLENKDELISGKGLTIKVAKHLKDTDMNEYDAYILPGGPGYTTYSKIPELKDVLLKANEEEKLIAAICAAPSYLAEIGLLDGKEATVYPELAEVLINNDKIEYAEEELITCENVITAPGLGWAIDFTLEIIAYLISDEKADEIAESIQY